MHILLIHQAFTSTAEPGGTRHAELAERLCRCGHEVTVVGGPSSYLTGERHAPVGPRSDESGLVVLRPWALAALHKSFVWRVLSFLTFMISSAVRAFRVRGTDVVWGTVPPSFQGVSALLVARARRRPLLLEVRDLWPDFAVAAGVLKEGRLVGVARKVERFLYRSADRIIINSPGFIAHVQSHGVPRERIVLIPNGVDVASYARATNGDRIRQEWGVRDQFVALYAGAHGVANDLSTLLHAAELLRDERDILFVLVGDGKDKPRLQEHCRQRGLKNVRFVEAQPKDRMPEVLAAADVCVAILKDAPMFATTYPNKVFDYLAAGKPVLLAIDGPIRTVVEQAGAGRFVTPGDPRALAEAIAAYRADTDELKRQGENGRRYVAQHFDRASQAAELEAVLLSLQR